MWPIHLTIDTIFNLDILRLKLPSKLTHLIFDDFSYFNRSLNGVLPTGLQQLTLGMTFNQPLNILPNELQYLTFGNSFNQPLNKLPDGLTYLTFGNSFNQPLHKLPDGLTHLTFGNSFLLPLPSGFLKFRCVNPRTQFFHRNAELAQHFVAAWLDRDGANS